MTDKDLSNVIQLFPNLTKEGYLTNEEYENKIMPSLIKVLGILDEDRGSGNYDRLIKISESLMRYAIRSLITLDTLRRSGSFDNGQLPPITAFDVDNLAADCALAMGGGTKMSKKLRNRSPKRRVLNDKY